MLMAYVNAPSLRFPLEMTLHQFSVGPLPYNCKNQNTPKGKRSFFFLNAKFWRERSEIIIFDLRGNCVNSEE